MQRPRGRDCPHIRGEKLHGRKVVRVEAGSPPRVRGKARGRGRDRAADGITPACAGKRTAPPTDQAAHRDHPRVCGEKCRKLQAKPSVKGSPPRVRGKDKIQRHRENQIQITPACAWKRRPVRRQARSCRDHPRVCGEKEVQGMPWSLAVGSPPRVRGKGQLRPQIKRYIGITPACAGKRYQ